MTDINTRYLFLNYISEELEVTVCKTNIDESAYTYFPNSAMPLIPVKQNWVKGGVGGLV